MREVAVMSLSSDSGRITVTLPIWIVGELRREAVSKTQHHRSDREDMFVKRNGTAGQRVPGSSAREVESTIVGVRPLLD